MKAVDEFTTVQGVEEQLRELDIEINRLQRIVNQKESELAPYQRELAALCKRHQLITRSPKMTDRMRKKNPEARISDHALVRYMERMKMVDVDAIRDSLLTPLIKDAILQGAKSVKTRGMRLCVENYVVTTIY